MIVSSLEVKKFLLEVVSAAPFQGLHAEFVASVKAELTAATIERPGAVNNTASDLMLESKGQG